MNQKIWSGIGKAALTTMVGTAVSLVSLPTYQVAANTENNSVTNRQLVNTTTDTSLLNQSVVQVQQALVTDNALSDTIPNQQEAAIATIYPHQWEDKAAVTLRVSNIPVLTFLSASEEEDPLVRAKAVATELNQLRAENFDAEKIAVSWDAQTKSYKIKIGDRALVDINEKTILPDTTKDLATDALQATNRLRRLMGNAEPLKEIAGLPAPQTVAAASATQLVKGGVKGGNKGMASWYGPGFHGRQTANGERFNQNALTAAHRSLPFGTKVRVTNVNNGRSVVVRINDRGPFAHGRVIDLSAGAAAVIGLTRSGVAPVRLEILGR